MDEARLLRLVDQALETGRAAEAVCIACPEYAPEVRRRVEAYHALQQRLDDLLLAVPTSPASRPFDGDTAALPSVPGYEVLGKLGSGGMGVVYLARQLSLGRRVAIKMLLAGPFARAAERERLWREARALARLHHPNIVGVYDVGEAEGHPYFSMEYLEGGSLAERQGGRPMAPGEAVRMVHVLADAVAAAHRQGVVHRDLKPANVLLTAEGTPKVSDFGIARAGDAGPTLTRTGARLGTPSYMAPEQALGRIADVGPATDVHALGAMLYELLTGRPPYHGATVTATERHLLHDDPIAPRLLVPGLPRDLETVCLKCLAKEPQRRYPDARALTDELGRLRRGEPILARPAERTERMVRWVRRHPARSAAIFAAAVAMGTALGAASWIRAQRATIDRAVREDLAEVVRLERADEWPEARNMLERAKTRLGDVDPDHPLARRAAVIERELDLVDELAGIRIRRMSDATSVENLAGWSLAYRDAFRAAGMLVLGEGAETAAARIAASPARVALVAALDDWMICSNVHVDHEWLFRVAQTLDPDPAWRDRVRALALRRGEGVEALAEAADVGAQPVRLLLAVAGHLLDRRSPSALLFLRRIQSAHPADFWANFALADALHASADAEAIAFYRVAVALRPEAAVAHAALGLALADHDATEAAIASMRRAAALEPDDSLAHYNLAVWLLRCKRLEESVHHGTIAARLHPTFPSVYGVLAQAHFRRNDFAAAAGALRAGLEAPWEDAALRARFTRMLADCEARLAGEAGPAPPR